VHVLLYAFMIGAPLTGWAMVSTDASRIPTLLYGTIPWPHLPLPHAINEPMEETHELLAWIGSRAGRAAPRGRAAASVPGPGRAVPAHGSGGSAWATGLLTLAGGGGLLRHRDAYFELGGCARRIPARAP
jgi:hypothetical protein